MTYFAGSLGATLDHGLVLNPEPEPPVEPPPPDEGYADTVTSLAGGAPIAYWRHGNTTQLTDSIGSRHGTFAGAVTLAAGLPVNSDGAIKYEGGTAEVVHDAGLSLETGALSFWIAVHSFPDLEVSPQMPVLVKDGLDSLSGGPTLGDFHIGVQDEGALHARFQTGTSATVVLTIIPDITIGQNYHCVIQWSPAGVECYLDAAFVMSNASFTNGLQGNTRPLGFAKPSFHAVTGDITLDEVALFDRLLTLSEITQLAQRTLTAPVANGETVAVNESATTAINVTANDAFVGNKADLTVEIMSQPAGGDSVSVNANNDVAYVAGAVAANTARSFTYRITDEVGTSNTATVNVTVLNVDAPVVGNANCFVIGAGGVVASMAALQAAVNAAAPGDDILVAPGNYAGGTLTFNRDGTQANPIVIRPQNGRGTVTITNHVWTTANTSSWLVFTGLYFDRGSTTFGGTHNRLSRNRYRAAAVILGDDASTLDCRIDHCEWTDLGASTRVCIDLRGAADFANGSKARLLIDYCYFHDVAATSQIIDQFGDNGRTANDLPTGETVTVDHCLFENIANNGEFIVNKCGGMVWRFCTFDGINGYFQFRSGAHCEVRSCWWEGIERCMFWSEDNLIIGNRFVGAADAWVPCGNGTWEDQQNDLNFPTNRYEPATNSRFIGNRFGTGHFLVGQYHNGAPGDPLPAYPANRNVLEANTRDGGGNAHLLVNGGAQMPLVPGSTNTTIRGTTTTAFVPAVKLTPANVGLAAGDPLCPGGPQA